MLGIIELNNDLETISSIGETVRFSYLSNKLEEVYFDFTRKLNITSSDPKKVVRALKTKCFDEELQEAFAIFGFIQTINERTPIYHKDIHNLRGK